MDSTYILLQHYWWFLVSTLHYRQDGDTAKNVIELDRA